MYRPKYAVFYDNHTMPSIQGIGKKFNAERFVSDLAENKVDYLVFHARCNMGNAYYDTKIGFRHPGLDFDLFGQLAAACQKYGIHLCAYFNGGLSHREGVLHPEWTAKLKQSYPYGTVSPWVRTMCLNTAYRRHLIEMAEEVAGKYPVSGFFFDCMLPFPCVCPDCIRKLAKEGIDFHDEKALAAFAERTPVEAAKEIGQALKKINPDYLIYFNGVGFEDQAEGGSYLELECIPTKEGSDYDYIQVLGRYMRTLGDKPLLNMTGRFYRWGDFGSLRPYTALRSELLNGLANGLRPSIGDHFLPDGTHDTPALRQTFALYRELRQYEPWNEEARAVAEIAILYPKSHSHIRKDRELYGAVRMLCELHYQFDVVTGLADWSKYRLLVLPDSVELDEKLSGKLETYLKQGGKIISSGNSGIAGERVQLAQYRRMEYVGKCPFEPAYFMAEKTFAADLPNMPLNPYSDGFIFKASGAKCGASLVEPAVNFHWDGIYPCYYTPPAAKTEHPFLIFSEQAAHFSHKVFTGYRMQGAPHLRTIFRNVLERMLPSPMLIADDLPHYARMTVMRQPSGRTIIHILAQIADKRAVGSEILEDDLTIRPFVLKVKKSVVPALKSVYLAPENHLMTFRPEGEFWRLDVPEFTGYAMLVLDNAEA